VGGKEPAGECDRSTELGGGRAKTQEKRDLGGEGDVSKRARPKAHLKQTFGTTSREKRNVFRKERRRG